MVARCAMSHGPRPPRDLATSPIKSTDGPGHHGTEVPRDRGPLGNEMLDGPSRHQRLGTFLSSTGLVPRLDGCSTPQVPGSHRADSPHAARSPVQPRPKSLGSTRLPRDLGIKWPYPDRAPRSPRTRWSLVPMSDRSAPYHGSDGALVYRCRRPMGALVARATRRQGPRRASVSRSSRGQQHPGIMPPPATWSGHRLDARVAVTPRYRDLHGLLVPRRSHDPGTWASLASRDQAAGERHGPWRPMAHGAQGGTMTMIAGIQAIQAAGGPWPAVHLGRDIVGSIPFQGAHRRLASWRLGPRLQPIPWPLGLLVRSVAGPLGGPCGRPATPPETDIRWPAG
jgi:hypothetical protein